MEADNPSSASELPPSARSTALAWWLPSRLPLTRSFSLPPACDCLAGGLCSGWRRARCPSVLDSQRTSVPGPSAAQSRRSGERTAARQAGSLAASSARRISACSLGPRLDKAAGGGWFLQPFPGLGHRRASSSSPAGGEHLATLGPGAPAASAPGASVVPASSARAGTGGEPAARPEPCAAPACRPSPSDAGFRWKYKVWAPAWKLLRPNSPGVAVGEGTGERGGRKGEEGGDLPEYCNRMMREESSGLTFMRHPFSSKLLSRVLFGWVFLAVVAA